MEPSEINNEFYGELGERWYVAQDDPVALLRAEHRAMFPWIIENIKHEGLESAEILDVGCGAGLFSNKLAKLNFSVTGIDLSEESLNIARKFDETKSVKYLAGDALNLPFADESFDVATCLDFLEHVENPEKVIAEISRVLKPRGLFFFHTFNRNFLSWLVVIKFVEWFVKNTPKNMHVLELFIKPEELKEMCQKHHLEVLQMKGVMPMVKSIDWAMAMKGEVSPTMQFKITKGTGISYLGLAKKMSLN